MQAKQAVNLERKGPHKSMHCKFCKPPGVVTPEKPSRAMLETKTKLHLTHEAADLKLCNLHAEPGVPAIESEACICVLEGENPCPKCVPDKNKPPPKKKVCRCPKGAKPHPSMFEEAVAKKKEEVEEDDEFWWEKYSREHDALAKETWAAYMAQRKKDKKFHKCQIREQEALTLKASKGRPTWYQKLSCQQIIYVEFLSTAIRLDSDENITDRTYFVLGGLGLYPRPQRKLLKKCLRYCHYNALQFLKQLQMLIKDDDFFREKLGYPKDVVTFTWNEKLIMNSICHLEFPTLLRELMDRLPLLPREKLLPQIPYPVYPKSEKKNYKYPYEEPIWQERLNWVEKMKIDRLNRCRAYMDTKRVKIPALALVRRPSLIDARPPFLAQIEANERASRRRVEEKVEKPVRKHKISTFNSAVDVTAIAGIEASEISTTDKADTDDICVFLRDPKEAESMEGEIEECDAFTEKEVRFLEKPNEEVKPCSVFEEASMLGEEEGEDIPFKTPPKTESGQTIQTPCPPPDATPGPPALHYDRAKRDLDVTNEEICTFYPFVTSSTQTVQSDLDEKEDNVAMKLKSAAQKLKKLVNNEPEAKGGRKNKKPKKCKNAGSKKCKCSAKTKKTKPKTPKTTKKTVVEMPYYSKEVTEDEEENNEENEFPDFNDTFKSEPFRSVSEKPSEKFSELSDPDPESDDEWSTRPPCMTDQERRVKSFHKQKKKKGKKSRSRRKKKHTKHSKGMELREETGEYLKKKKSKRVEKETMTESSTEQHSDSNKEKKSGKGEEGEESEGKGEDVFQGAVKPLVQQILKDLAEEGFNCASFDNIDGHPIICQLILYLKGIIVNQKVRTKMQNLSLTLFNALKGLPKFRIPELGINAKKVNKANWNDKKWISKLAKRNKDEFYFKVAKTRADYGTEIYGVFKQEYFGTDRYLKIFYAYMTAKYEDALLRGVL